MMATASSSTAAEHSPLFVLPNISHLVLVKLDRSNYLLMISQFLPVLRSHDLFGTVDGSEPCPPKYIKDLTSGKDSTQINPAYQIWNKKDQYILSWLNATLSESVLSTVYGMNTARRVWTSLAKSFASQSHSRINQFKRQLQKILNKDFLLVWNSFIKPSFRTT